MVWTEKAIDAEIEAGYPEGLAIKALELATNNGFVDYTRAGEVLNIAIAMARDKQNLIKISIFDSDLEIQQSQLELVNIAAHMSYEERFKLQAKDIFNEVVCNANTALELAYVANEIASQSGFNDLAWASRIMLNSTRRKTDSTDQTVHLKYLKLIFKRHCLYLRSMSNLHHHFTGKRIT